MSQTLPGSKTIDIGNNKTIRVQTLREYVKRHSDFVRLRLKFLIWEVDIELVEAFSAFAIWAVFTDIINLQVFHIHNLLYDVLFNMMPPLWWVLISGLIGFVHITSIFLDKSSEPGFDYNEPKSLCYLFARSRMMFLSFAFNACVTLSVVVGHSYVLVWKYQLLFVIASLLSYIRLNKQYTVFVKLRKRDNVNAISSHTD